MRYREAARKLQMLGCQELPRRGGGSYKMLLIIYFGSSAIASRSGITDLE